MRTYTEWLEQKLLEMEPEHICWAIHGECEMECEGTMKASCLKKAYLVLEKGGLNEEE